ncbi:MAG TPA: hypothetical protein VMU68_07550 [Acidimicrobiales bacterium]|nr:hypothetical protein [Acidimicrobiales bacterium]
MSLVSTPNALADYNVGCGYGYNSSGGGFGYGSGNAFGYGYNQYGVFGYGYGNQVCPPAPPTTTTTLGGGGGGTTTTSPTTSTTSVTTTTAPVTTTTTIAHHGRRHLFARKVHGFARVGKTRRLAITGGGFYGQPTITSNEPGTKVGVQHDYGNVLIIKITVPAGSAKGWHTLTITEPDGQSCKVNYLVK